MIIWPVILAVVVIIAWIVRYFTRDNRSYFSRTAGAAKAVKVETISREKGYRTDRFVISASRGFTLTGYLKVPDVKDRKLPVYIILGGLFTGKEVVGLLYDLPGIEPYVIASMDYPYEGEKRLKWWQILFMLPRIRRAAMNSVRGVLLMLDMLQQHPCVDSSRLYVVGVSFGAFFGMAAAAVDSRIKSVASLFGGGKIRRLIAVNLPFRLPLVNALTGRLAYWLVHPLEPLQYARYIAPRPLLVVGGSDDEKFPADCAQALYDAAGEPRDILWFSSKHVEPTKNDLTLELTETVVAWMKGKGLLREE